MKGAAYEDKVWTDEPHKLEGIRRDLCEARGEGQNVLVVAHFEGALSVLTKRLRECAVELKTHPPGDGAALCGTTHGAGAGQQAWAVLASHLWAGAGAGARQSGEVRLRVLVAEHHPLLPRDEALLAALAKLPCRSRVTFHTALTDALLARVVGEGTFDLLKKLGHTDDECLSHPFISRAIRSLQEKIGKSARGDMPALSAEDWFKYNARPST